MCIAEGGAEWGAEMDVNIVGVIVEVEARREARAVGADAEYWIVVVCEPEVEAVGGGGVTGVTGDEVEDWGV